MALGVVAVLATVAGKALLRRNAHRYLVRVLGIAEAHHVRRRDIDWTSVRAEAERLSADALTPGQTRPAIQFVLRQLDRHSGLIEGDVWARASAPNGLPNRPPEGRPLDNGIAYVEIPAFVGTDDTAMRRAASAIQAVIRRLDMPGGCGWVIDVRFNNGGNMWPMLAGLSPFFGDGLVGSFVTPDGARTAWLIQSGTALSGGEMRAAVDVPYHLRQPNPPVALLVGPTTKSAGEAVATAFQGRPRTRTFGLRTAGNTTSNQPFALSDGAFLNLSVAYYADRRGHEYTNGIDPDLSVTTRRDEVPTQATQWLEQVGCSKGGTDQH